MGEEKAGDVKVLVWKGFFGTDDEWSGWLTLSLRVSNDLSLSGYRTDVL